MENPLSNFYRNKEIFVKLPTGGRWLSNNPKLTFDGEIGVQPMTMQDEMLLTIPDALYNGQAIFQLMSSIVPDIDDPYEISLPDVDVLLLASRAASIDKSMQVEARCTHCENINLYEIDLARVLSNVKVLGEETVVEMDGLKIEIRPNTLSAASAGNIQIAESAKALGALRDQALGEETTELYKQSIANATAGKIAMIADGIVSITLPDGTVVSELKHIADWLSNSNKQSIESLQKQQVKLNDNGLNRNFNFTCAEEDCGLDFEGNITYNPSFFFKPE